MIAKKDANIGEFLHGYNAGIILIHCSKDGFEKVFVAIDCLAKTLSSLEGKIDIFCPLRVIGGREDLHCLNWNSEHIVILSNGMLTHIRPFHENRYLLDVISMFAMGGVIPEHV